MLTTAGDPSHWSAEVLSHTKGSNRWHVHEQPGPLPWRTEDDLDEQRALLTESSYARLHLNSWTAPEAGSRRPTLFRDCVVLDGPQTHARAALRRRRRPRPERDRTAVVVAHAEDDEDGPRTFVLDRVACWQGSRQEPVQLGEVEAWLLHAVRDFHGARVVLDPWQAAQLAERLRASG